MTAIVQRSAALFVAILPFLSRADLTITSQAPFGTCFVEGAAAAVEWAVSWPGAERRRVAIAGTLTDDRGMASGARSAAAERSPGDPIALPLSGGGADELGPGLYFFDGALTCARTSQPVRIQFGILNRELHAVPNDEIPDWMGMGNALTRIEDPGLAREVFAFLHTLGVRSVRTAILWEKISGREGLFDWSRTDLHLGLAEQYGMQTVALLGWWARYWPEHMRAIRERGERPLYTPEGRQFWADAYLVPVLERYGGRIRLVEILNEPNAHWNEDNPPAATGFARQIGSPIYYADLVLRCWNAARTIDPSARVTAALASTGWREDIPRLLELGIGKTLPAGLTIHNYGGLFERRMSVVNEILAAEGVPPPPLAVTEIGMKIDPENPRQDAALARTLAETYLSVPSIPNEMLTVNWYTLTGMPPSRDPYEFGILHGLQADRGAVAYHTVARLLAGAERGTSETRGKLRIHRVRRADRPPLVAVRGTARRAVPVTLARAGSDPVRAWDLMGRAVEIDWRGETAEFDVGEEWLLMEGDVRMAPRTHLALEPGPERCVRVRALTARAETTDATLRLTVEDGETREVPVLLMPGENLYDVRIGRAAGGEPLAVRASLVWREGAAEAVQTFAPGFVTDSTPAGDSLRPPAGTVDLPSIASLTEEAWDARGPGWRGDFDAWRVFVGDPEAEPNGFLENWGGEGSTLSAVWPPAEEAGRSFEIDYGWKWGGEAQLVFGARETEWRLALRVSSQPGEQKYRASWVREVGVRDAPPIRAPDVKDLGSHAGGGEDNGFAARLTLRFKADPARVLLYRDGEQLAEMIPPARFIPNWFTATDHGEYWRLFSLTVR
jgi:hypothetical protein